MAKQAKVLNANLLARKMLDKILGLQIPQKFQESVELLMLKSGGLVGASESPEEEVAPLCWRCRRHTPMFATHCPRCKHVLAHSLATHEVLPLVQFVPAEGITCEEAMDLIDRMLLPEEKSTDGAEILKINHDIDSADPFLEKTDEDDESGVVVCCRKTLLQLNPASVVIVQKTGIPPVFYRNMLPELPVTTCDYCQNLYYMEDFEIQLITKGHCGFCRHPTEEEKNQDNNDSSASTPSSPSNEHGSWR